MGRFLSLDPLTSSFPELTPYQFASNSPIANIDLDGAEAMPAVSGTQEGQSQTTSKKVFGARGSYEETKEWFWHAGGLRDRDGNISKAGWHTSDEYVTVLRGTNAAAALADDLNLFNSTAKIGRPGFVKTDKEQLQDFIGGGLNGNASKHLIAAAKARADGANYSVTGVTYATSFNVEDMLGVGILVKQGMKYLGGLAAKNVVLAESKQLLLQAPEVIHRHHVLPQEFKAWFKKQGITNIDNYTVEISAQTHLRGVHGKGFGNLPGQWNKKWGEFIKANPKANPSEIFNQAEGLLKQYGLEHLPYVPYKK